MLPNIVKRLTGWGFRKSSRITRYQAVATHYGLSTRKVYMLVHGRRPRTERESQAVHRLKEVGLFWTGKITRRG